MALCEDESCGLARVTSDDRIVRSIRTCGKQREPSQPALPGVPTPGARPTMLTVTLALMRVGTDENAPTPPPEGRYPAWADARLARSRSSMLVQVLARQPERDSVAVSDSFTT